MLSNHKLQITLEEIKEVSRIDFALYTDKGRLLASTYDPGEEMAGAVCNFAESMAESQMLSGYHFFKIMDVEGFGESREPVRRMPVPDDVCYDKKKK